MDSSSTNGAATVDDTAAVEEEILELERRLAEAKLRLQSKQGASPSSSSSPPQPPLSPTTQATHFLLLLSDSALPLGSFAFSSGLESYLAHASPATARQVRPSTLATSFFPPSISSLASAQLPFVLAAHRNPEALPDLDDALDAAIVCTVGKRASVAQGRALLGVWGKSFLGVVSSDEGSVGRVLARFAKLLASASGGGTAGSSTEEDEPPLVSGHLAPLFGAIANAVGLSLQQTAYVFMLSHVKALVSAAVRAGTFGPYQAQKVLAGAEMQSLINAVIEREWGTPVEEAGQSVPVMDLWIGRHEILYSRIFNS